MFYASGVDYSFLLVSRMFNVLSDSERVAYRERILRLRVLDMGVVCRRSKIKFAPDRDWWTNGPTVANAVVSIGRPTALIAVFEGPRRLSR